MRNTIHKFSFANLCQGKFVLYVVGIIQRLLITVADLPWAISATSHHGSIVIYDSKQRR